MKTRSVVKDGRGEISHLKHTNLDSDISEVLLGTFINLIPDALVQKGASVGTMQRRPVRGNKNIW